MAEIVIPAKLDLNLENVKRECENAIRDCSHRGLLQSEKWLAELYFALRDVNLSEEDKLQEALDEDLAAEKELYVMSKSYFNVKEYERCAYFTESCQSTQGKFLHFYSRYLAAEKKRLDDLADAEASNDSNKLVPLRLLRVELQKDYSNKLFDGYGLYLYGVVLKKLDLKQNAVEILQEAVNKAPMHWGSWLELASLITDKEMLRTLSLPDHWIKHFFLAHIFLELQLSQTALEMYTRLQEVGFDKSLYITSQLALIHHNMRKVDQAVETFRELQEADPFRLDEMDIYSNLLYVKEMRVELSHLAHHMCSIDRYRVETCCVIANYYSLRGQHEKAVVYFQRALKLNPDYLPAWTLMGHEYMEMKNTVAALQSYRQATEVNCRDFRAWYGLGQAYEILKMSYYSLYYYKQALYLRPNDSRMLVALGDSYERVDRLQEAKKCFWKAHSVGDFEGIALHRLARLYSKLGEEEQAAAAYLEYTQGSETSGLPTQDEEAEAFCYLANYYLKRNMLDEASAYAQRCTNYAEKREEGKSLLREIAQKRPLQENSLHEHMEGCNVTQRFQQTTGDTPLGRLSPMNLSFTP